MAYVTKKSAVVYVTEEVTEGTAVAPSAGNQAVGVLADGFELNGEKELLDRTLLRSGILKQVPRTGIKTSTATLAVEASANSTAGSAPEYDLLMEGLLGGRRQTTSTTTTKATGNTASVLQIEDADIGNFAVGDIVLVKEAGAYHLSPVTAVDTTGSAANITLLVAASGAFSASVVIEKFTTYYGANTGHPSLTVTNFLEDAIKVQAAGCKVTSLSLDGFETGQLPSFNFSLGGQSYAETLAASGLTATYANSAPPIVLDACVYLDGALIPVNSVGLSIENTAGRVTSTCSPNGIIAQLMTERAVSGSLVPYMDTTDVSLYTKFNLNTEFSLFLRAWNPTAVAGEKQQAWGVFLPKCVVTALPKADQDGVMQYSLEFQAGEDSTGTYPTEVYIGFC